MTKDDKIRIRNLRIKYDGTTGDCKSAFYVGNDDNLRITVDTDDCDSELAKAAFKRVMTIVNMCQGLEIAQIKHAIDG